MKTYKKPVVTVDAGMAEGVYAASGAKGTLNVTYHGVWDRWGTNGGKGLATANWSGINGTITLNITFNDTVDQVETDDAYAAFRSCVQQNPDCSPPAAFPRYPSVFLPK